ncbi:hypothetical protein BN159_7936 [Streptomyces davaonensis JCM 4913]|uniref:Uncharacterized protein n=1 Tax=Streptomyces davaonensis (strain DSM 101723 / JCM 4913 / KCC S-0913 / 768) TaxID=1214101 RepID=K4RFF2_STRDJ|nr:hypothetical protein [Streptomyces davaonensis]CCK32315.1 hypothetical protein BN159_7936 [Streptomyces davaonensis JCM 4913]
MNAEPSKRKSSARRGAASRGAARSRTRAEHGGGPDRAESDTAGVAGIRLDLPIMGPTVERRWDLYEPYLVVVGTYDPVDQPEGVIGHYMDSQFASGHVVADPAPSADRDARGWSCPPGGHCVWGGIV